MIILCVVYFLYFLDVFNESTARGLEFYGKDTSYFLQTFKFVQFVCDLWKIMLLRSLLKDDII